MGSELGPGTNHIPGISEEEIELPMLDSCLTASFFAIPARLLGVNSLSNIDFQYDILQRLYRLTQRSENN